MKKILLLLLPGLLSVSFVWAQSKIDKSFSGVKRIRINTISGDCKLIKSPDATVVVNLTHTYDDHGFAPEISQTGDHLVIREEFEARSVRGNALWQLTIPDGMEVEYVTASGSIAASELTLDLDISTASGDIDLFGVNGTIKSNTGSGNYELQDFSGSLRANSGSGEMRITKAKGDLDLNCGSGDIHIEESNAIIAANTGSGNIDASRFTLNGTSRFNSGSGDVEVALAASPNFNLAVNSGSGSAKLDMNGNAIAGRLVMKANKSNGVITAPFKFDNTEEISEWGNQVTVVKTLVKGNSDVQIGVSTGSGEAVITEK